MCLTGSASGCALRLEYVKSTGRAFSCGAPRSKPVITQWTAAAPGASDVHAKVWCAKRILQPPSSRGRKSEATGAPCAIELVETKAKRPPRGTDWKYWEALMNQPVT